jgi:hypothetical protein
MSHSKQWTVSHFFLYIFLRHFLPFLFAGISCHPPIHLLSSKFTSGRNSPRGLLAPPPTPVRYLAPIHNSPLQLRRGSRPVRTAVEVVIDCTPRHVLQFDVLICNLPYSCVGVSACDLCLVIHFPTWYPCFCVCTGLLLTVYLWNVHFVELKVCCIF